MNLKLVMSSKAGIRSVAAVICLWVIFVTGRMLYPVAAPAAAVSDLLAVQRPSEVAKREVKRLLLDTP